jgi:hypothetical protein
MKYTLHWSTPEMGEWVREINSVSEQWAVDKTYAIAKRCRLLGSVLALSDGVKVIVEFRISKVDVEWFGKNPTG